jgi:ribosomal protein S25
MLKTEKALAPLFIAKKLKINVLDAIKILEALKDQGIVEKKGKVFKLKLNS